MKLGDLRIIGSRLRKVDGLAKSTGRADYTDDIALPGMLHGKILRSPHPHARIVSVDTSKAEALEGVHAVITGRDMPVKYGIIPWTPDEYPLAVDKVRFVGDGVAAVAAVDEDTAIRALELIEVEYEELRPWFDPVEAVEATEGEWVHEPRKEKHPNGNITKVVDLEFGDVERLMDDSDVVVEGEYYFEGTTHAPIEPHCAIGLFEADSGVADGSGAGAGTERGDWSAAGGREEDGPAGKLTVWSSTQVPHYL
ncbi:MAG: molybdopterin-dependent oxidoreductase, partial [Gemmatimonadetes bacterium]|nr:molybdopterin-dependent oxidoreductase [Gemmatimonadota bacterium]